MAHTIWTIYNGTPESFFIPWEVRPIDMAEKLIKIEESDFLDREHFSMVQCKRYWMGKGYKISRKNLLIKKKFKISRKNFMSFKEHARLKLLGWDPFNGKKCEDVLNDKLRRGFKLIFTRWRSRAIKY